MQISSVSRSSAVVACWLPLLAASVVVVVLGLSAASSVSPWRVAAVATGAVVSPVSPAPPALLRYQSGPDSPAARVHGLLSANRLPRDELQTLLEAAQIWTNGHMGASRCPGHPGRTGAGDGAAAGCPTRSTGRLGSSSECTPPTLSTAGRGGRRWTSGAGRCRCRLDGEVESVCAAQRQPRRRLLTVTAALRRAAHTLLTSTNP